MNGEKTGRVVSFSMLVITVTAKCIFLFRDCYHAQDLLTHPATRQSAGDKVPWHCTKVPIIHSVCLDKMMRLTSEYNNLVFITR
jgi:hypothetical protein